MMAEATLAMLLAILVNVFVLLYLRKCYGDELYGFVVRVYGATLALRYLLAFYIWLRHNEPGFSMAFWGDSRTYDVFGAMVAEAWTHGESFSAWKTTVEGMVNRGFIYFVAGVYYVFGRNVLLVQFLNGVIGALTPIVLFEIGLLVYDKQVARTAMLLTAFFPQMIFWSAALYKDPAVMLCIAVNILAVLKLKEHLRPGWILLYAISAAALVWLRFYIFYATLAATLAGLLVRHRRGVVFGLASQLSLVAAVIVLLLYTPVGREILWQSRYFDLQVLDYARSDLAKAGSGFGAEADVATFGGVLAFLPIGVGHLLFAPFPWAISGLRQALALPDVLMWYALVPALVRGLFGAYRRLRQTMPILVFTTALTLAYGAFLGNVGTAYRQRTQIMMFYFLFVADGLSRRSSGHRASADPECIPPAGKWPTRSGRTEGRTPSEMTFYRGASPERPQSARKQLD